MKKISEEWLKAAKDDLRVADKIISDEALTHMVAFHCQQCIERKISQSNHGRVWYRLGKDSQSGKTARNCQESCAN